VKDLERLLKSRTYRENPTYMLAYADALLALGRGKEAYDAYRLVVGHGDSAAGQRGMARADPVRALAEFGVDRGDDVYPLARGDALRAAGRRAEAIAAYQQLVEGFAEEALAPLAEMAPEPWLARLRAAVEANAEDPDAWLLLADALRALGRGREAREAYERAFRCDPGSPHVLVRRCLGR
jgi:tetratricopeptide (TPR) repeat protein